MGSKIGLDAKLYKDGAEVRGITGDLALNIEAAEIDDSSRDIDWKVYLAGRFDASIEFDIKNSTDSDCAAFAAAFFGRSKLDLDCLDSPGGSGVKGSWVVLKFSRTEPVDGVQTYAVSIKPALDDSGNPPQWQG